MVWLIIVNLSGLLVFFPNPYSINLDKPAMFAAYAGFFLDNK